ncbi:MAG: NYN domain-containing protein [Chloroflexota bacterium]|nr:NYN domain-containing protein [Chloroflexota bacterium]MDE2959792.1 NYN domain-containing protein [Chloroflexota bacterium]
MPDRKMLTHPKAAQPSTSPGAALYVDAENLRDAENARQVVASVVADWPGSRPPLGSLSLYVRADKAELWRLWAEDAFPTLSVRVRGVQHFSANNSKNSADMAIAADAVSDLVTGRANDVAVVSNDSDFAALFVKVRELAYEAGAESAPFLWITAPDGGALSPEIEQFIPAAFRWDLSAPSVSSPAQPAPKPLATAARRALPAASTEVSISDEAVAEELLRALPVGRFGASDAQKVVKDRWPKHPEAASDTAKFGQFLGKSLWPQLEKCGVTMPRRSSPRVYEITQAAKNSLGRSQPDQSAASVRTSQTDVATPEKLAAVVANGIADDIFKASDAQNALNDGQPQHPAASYTAAQFGTWFAKQLWPIMEQHGVTIAKEKPRRYEMTPDARHKLTALA